MLDERDRVQFTPEELRANRRIEMGAYGPKARDKAPKDRFAVLNKKAG